MRLNQESSTAILNHPFFPPTLLFVQYASVWSITIYRTYFTVPVIIASLGTRRIEAFIKTAFFHPLHLKLDRVTDAKETGRIQRCVCYVLYGSKGLCSKLIIDFAGIHFVPIYAYAEQLSCLNNDLVFPQNYIMRR